MVNGSLASTVTLDTGGTLGGSGTIGGLVSNGGTLAPGNSIGTLNVNGNFSQNGGTYSSRSMPQGQSDRINVTGTATINGGTVQVVAAAGQLWQQHDLHHPQCHRRRVPAPTPASRSNFAFLTPSLSYNANNVFLTLALQGRRLLGLRRQHGQPAGGGLCARPVLRQRHRRLRHGDRRAGRPQHPAGPAGAEPDQRPALCRLRHVQRRQQRAVHERARPADGAGARRRRQRPAPGAGRGVRCRRLRRREPVQRLGQRFGRRRLGAGRRQRSSAFTYNVGGAAAGIDYRLDPRFLVGLGVGYTNGTQWVEQLPGQGLDQHGQRRGLRQLHAVGLLRRRAGGLRLLQQPAAAADPDPRPAAAHGQRQHRRQPVPGPGRDRLQGRRLRAGGGDAHAVRALPGLERDAERLHRVGRASR